MDVAVVGGGFCGALVARKLQRQPDVAVTLVDRTPFFEYTPGVHRLVCAPNKNLILSVPYQRFLPRARVVVGDVVHLTPDMVETERERVSFDRAVVATGVIYPVLLDASRDVYTLTSVAEALTLAAALRDAGRVLVVGGGLIGVELAAELVEKMPHPHVTVVHSHDRLLERNPPSASRHAQRFLERHGAHVVLGEKVVDRHGNLFVTDGGWRISADVAVWCTGIRHNPDFLGGLDEVLDERNAVRVNDFLQLPGYPHIYAGGDVTNIREEKTAQNAERHARVIAKNIIQNNEPKIVYRPRSTPMVISLGSRRGILSWHGRSMDGRLPGLLKKLVRWWTMRGSR
ncbi:MAG: FAD-dependent oxidoreductase [Thermoplasmatota archaeon]